MGTPHLDDKCSFVVSRTVGRRLVSWNGYPLILWDCSTCWNFLFFALDLKLAPCASSFRLLQYNGTISQSSVPKVGSGRSGLAMQIPHQQ